MANPTVVKNDSDSIQIALNQKARRNERIRSVLPFVGLIFLIVLYIIISKGQFIGKENLGNLVNQCFQVTLVAIGAAFIYAAGMMDMSIGGVSCVAMLLMGVLMRDYSINAYLAMLVGMATAVLCTLVTAGVHVLLNVPVFVGSLCVMNICNGIAQGVTSKNEIYINYETYAAFNSTGAKITVLVLLFAIGWIIFNYTRLGKDLKALGGNQTAAELSGVKRKTTIVLAFVLLGCCLGITSFFCLTRAAIVNAQSGSSLMMNIMTAIVLGGFPLAGGARSKFFAPVIGALTVTVLLNGLQLLGLDPAWGVIAKGVLFLVVVGMTYERTKYIS